MAVMIKLTSAAHGGSKAGTICGTGSCGTDCDCGCPYTGIEDKGQLEWIAAVEARYPNEWLAFVIPPTEDDEYPQRGMLVVHSADDNEVWDAVNRVTHNQVVHTYYNGALDQSYLDWAGSEPAPRGARVPSGDPPWLQHGKLVPMTIEC